MQKIKTILSMCTILVVTGCTQVQTRREGESRLPTVPSRSRGEVNDFAGNDDSTPAQVETQSPTVPAVDEEKKVAVILGPGGYKSFAHAGVLKEFSKRNIPIHKIAGIEWGALVAGLYAQRGQINEAEWKLYKIEKLDLAGGSFFSSKNEMNSIKTLEGFLNENLNLNDVAKATVPFFCPSLSLAQGTQSWQDRGPMAKAVMNCMAYPPLFKPAQQQVAGLFSVEDMVRRLKNEGYNVVILVNVLGDGNLFDNSSRKDDYATTILWGEARREMWRAKSLATDVVDVNTRGVSLSDFESRKLLVTAGEAAGEKSAKILSSKYGF
jgi:NTE family protein